MATASVPVSLVYTLLIHWCLRIATTVALWDGFSTRILRSSANNNHVHLISTNPTTVFNCVLYQLINNLATHYTTSHQRSCLQLLSNYILAGMAHSVSRCMQGVQVILWDPLKTCAIPERLRGRITTRRYTNPRLPLPLPKSVNHSTPKFSPVTTIPEVPAAWTYSSFSVFSKSHHFQSTHSVCLPLTSTVMQHFLQSVTQSPNITKKQMALVHTDKFPN